MSFFSTPPPSVPADQPGFPDLVTRGEELAFTGAQTWILVAIGATILALGFVLWALSMNGGRR